MYKKYNAKEKQALDYKLWSLQFILRFHSGWGWTPWLLAGNVFFWGGGELPFESLGEVPTYFTFYVSVISRINVYLCVVLRFKCRCLFCLHSNVFSLYAFLHCMHSYTKTKTKKTFRGGEIEKKKWFFFHFLFGTWGFPGGKIEQKNTLFCTSAICWCEKHFGDLLMWETHHTWDRLPFADWLAFVEFLRVLGNQSGVSVRQHTLVG